MLRMRNDPAVAQRRKERRVEDLKHIAKQQQRIRPETKSTLQVLAAEDQERERAALAAAAKKRPKKRATIKKKQPKAAPAIAARELTPSENMLGFFNEIQEKREAAWKEAGSPPSWSPEFFAMPPFDQTHPREKQIREVAEWLGWLTGNPRDVSDLLTDCGPYWWSRQVWLMTIHDSVLAEHLLAVAREFAAADVLLSQRNLNARFGLLPVSQFTHEKRIEIRSEIATLSTDTRLKPPLSKRLLELVVTQLSVRATEWSAEAAEIESAAEQYYRPGLDGDHSSPPVVECGGETRELDGPCGVYKWRHNGIVGDKKMQRQTWRLAEYLFKRKGRMVPIRNLIGSGSVFSDPLTAEEAITRHGSRANVWFRDSQIPLTISSSVIDGTIQMESVPDSDSGNN